MTTSGYQLSLVDSAAATLLELMENANALYRFDVLGQDATLGNPVPVTEVVSSLMTDGGLTTLKSFNNRTAVFLVTITAPDPGALASGEAELMSALDRVAALEWVSPFAAASYFDVVACWSEHVFDDLTEVRQMQRQFRLSFECLPFARSRDVVTVSWTGPVELDPLTSIAGGSGWTTVSGSANIADGIHTSTSWTGRHTFTVDEYLWFKVSRVGATLGERGLTNVKVNGTAIPDAQIRKEAFGGNETTQFFTVPVRAWRGQSVTVEFKLTVGSFATDATLAELWTTGYPSPTSDSAATKPRGIGAVDVAGTARTPCTISFTAPAGGAFVYTGPDPAAAIRDDGAPEVVYAKFTVAAGNGAEITVGGQLMWFPPGDHRTNIGLTAPQPLELNPNGVWPTQPTGALDLGASTSSESQWSYPADAKAAISFFDTTGAKTLISASPALPQGYHGDAVTHEQHALHPGRSGFAVLDVNGDPITTTVTYYPRWRHHAAQ